MSISLKAGILGILRRSRREVNHSNQEQGRSGEAQAKAKWEMNGWKMTRTGKGHDYRATRKNWRTGKTETKYVEVKTGNSQLSPLQKKKKKQLGSKYVEERIDSNPLIGIGRTLFLGSENSSHKQKSRKSSNVSTLDILFGSPKPSRRRTSRTKPSRTRKSKGRSNLDILFGSPKPSRTRKSKGRSNLDILFGSPKPSRTRKSKGRSNVDSIWGCSSQGSRKSKGRSNVDSIWGSGSDSVSIW